MKILILLFMFFVLGALLIVSNEGMNFQENSDFADFGSSYIKWIGKVGSNFGDITGRAIGLDWS